MIDISSNIAVIRETSSGSELRTNIASGMETLAGKAASSDDVTAANESVAAMETKITETNTAIQEVYDAQTALNDKMKELEEQCSALQKSGWCMLNGRYCNYNRITGNSKQSLGYECARKYCSCSGKIAESSGRAKYHSRKPEKFKIISSKSIHTKYGKYIAIQKRPTRQNQSQIGTGFRQNHFAVWKMRQRCVLYNLR